MGWGDELMAAGEVRKAFAGERIAILNSPKGAPRWHVAWDNNPQIVKPGEHYRQYIVNAPGFRGYVQSWNNKRWIWKRYKPTPAKIYWSIAELDAVADLESGFIALEPHTKQKMEAVNRDWGWHKWVALAEMLRPHRIVQFGDRTTRLLPGAELFITPSPRIMAAALARAKAFVSTEGGFHHTAAAVNVPGVVIYGHFNSPWITGYDIHRSLFAGGIGCGSRVKCSLCREYMDDLTAQAVMDELHIVLTKGTDHG